MRIFRFLIPTLLCVAASATTITITGAPFNYNGVAVGPYTATLDGVPNILVFCLDMNLTTYIGQQYAGQMVLATTQQEDEAAFLAVYALQHGAPNAGLVTSLEGPVSMAIWQLMGSLDVAPDPAAQPFVLMADNAYNHGLFPPYVVAGARIWQPDNAGSSQRFMTVDPTAAPEPGTMIFMCFGVLLIACGLAGRKSANESPNR